MSFVNNVEMAGVYWIANNFIWGYLLLPINSLGEIIKSEANQIDFNIKKYFEITTVIVLILIVLSPLYKYWLEDIMLVKETEQVISILATLSLFYIVYMFNVVIDSFFIGKGKTNYLIISSLVTNLLYYPIVLNLNIFQTDINGICQLFGFGMVINFIVILMIYIWYVNK